MKPFRYLLLGACLVPALALADVKVSEAWVRATVPGQRTSGAFMTVTSSDDVSLVGARSPVAGSIEIHEMRMDAGVMKMRAVERLPVRSNVPLRLESGGYHVMLVGLSRPLAAGEAVSLTLTFEDAGGRRSDVQVSAPVRPLGAGHGVKH